MKNNSTVTPPGNLPVGEPEDMFADTEKGASRAPISEVPESVAQPPASALGAGILRPKQPVTPATDYAQPAPTSMSAGQGQEMYKIKEPALTRGLIMVVIIVVVVAILGGGGWWIYSSFIQQDNSLVGNTEIVAPIIETEGAVVAPDETTLLVDETATEETGADAISEVATDVIEDQVLFGEPIDKDGDSLDDLKEAELGTDPANWDSDNDELGDGDEILIWQTDPLNPDSDGDSYLDGAEVKNGYLPSGPGKIFEPPKE